MRWMNDDEQVEYDSAMQAAYDFGGGDVGFEKGIGASRLHDLLLDAEANERGWATRVLDEMVLEGCGDHLKKWAKSRVVTAVVVGSDGRIAGKTLMRGVRKHDEAGQISHQQMLFQLMTWDQFDAWLRDMTTQLRGLIDTRAMASKISKLRVAVPESIGPEDAAKKLGTSLVDYLAVAS